MISFSQARLAAGKIVSSLRFGLSVRRFVRERMTVEDARAIVRERLARREERFLALARRAILENPRSAYRKMLLEAGVDWPRLTALVRRHGVEGALEELLGRGVFVSYEEFKALTTEGKADAAKFGRGVSFDNPLSGPGFEIRSGGSRSAGARLFMDFNSIREVTPHRLLRFVEYDCLEALQTRYVPILPSAVGMSRVLMDNYARLPNGPWFSPTDPRRAPLAFRAQTAWFLAALRLAGGAVSWPRYVPLERVHPIARWIAERKREGLGCALHGYSTSNVRICAAAREEGLDIAGTRFVMLGEPVTAAKQDYIQGSGCVAINSYAITEAGQVGNSCRFSPAPEDVHFFHDSFALIRRERRLPTGQVVRPFLLTTLLPGAAKILFNVEIDDCGDLSERPCDCVWGRLGLTRRLSNVRSFVKLTTEGMTFLGTDLVQTIERGLPERFGGGPADWQLLEEEDEQGRSRLTLRASPRLGGIDEEAAIRFLYERIRATGAAGRLFSDVWKEGRAVRMERKDPLATPAGKVFPFHTLRR
ncbi:MAG: hypothetical protein NTW86_22940 [Candidatus Sumerlaeota bacterium]|nr:hypothetical protein [Candidatus Sumerlaeota bacterium]